MREVIEIVERLRKGPIKEIIGGRMNEFESFQGKGSNEIFKELCFCLLTANFSASGGIRIQNALGDGLLAFDENELAERLKELGHRFPNARAKYIAEARIHKDSIKEKLDSIETEEEKRIWLVENIKGLGMKEASHFLRNIGHKNLSIVDFHIVDLLARHGIIEQPKSRSLTVKKYVEIENVLRKIAEATGTNLGELDLYLWYEETGKVLK